MSECFGNILVLRLRLVFASSNLMYVVAPSFIHPNSLVREVFTEHLICARHSLFKVLQPHYSASRNAARIRTC